MQPRAHLPYITGQLHALMEANVLSLYFSIRQQDAVTLITCVGLHIYSVSLLNHLAISSIHNWLRTFQAHLITWLIIYEVKWNSAWRMSLPRAHVIGSKLQIYKSLEWTTIQYRMQKQLKFQNHVKMCKLDSCKTVHHIDFETPHLVHWMN